MQRRRARGRPEKSGQLIHLRIPDKMYRTLKDRAAADDRSLTATVERLLRAALTLKGEQK